MDGSAFPFASLRQMVILRGLVRTRTGCSCWPTLIRAMVCMGQREEKMRAAFLPSRTRDGQVMISISSCLPATVTVFRWSGWNLLSLAVGTAGHGQAGRI